MSLAAVIAALIPAFQTALLVALATLQTLAAIATTLTAAFRTLLLVVFAALRTGSLKALAAKAATLAAAVTALFVAFTTLGFAALIALTAMVPGLAAMRRGRTLAPMAGATGVLASTVTAGSG